MKKPGIKKQVVPTKLENPQITVDFDERTIFLKGPKITGRDLYINCKKFWTEAPANKYPFPLSAINEIQFIVQEPWTILNPNKIFFAKIYQGGIEYSTVKVVSSKLEKKPYKNIKLGLNSS